MDYGRGLSERNVIVFGASRGIGFNIASHLIAKGSNVSISSGNINNLNMAFDALKKQYPAAQNISKLRADLYSHSTLEAELAPLRQCDAFDAVVISSAVLGPSGDFAQTSIAQWVDTFHVNVFGPAALVHYFLQCELLRKNGKIIFISGGISGPDPHFISFSSTKHALNGFAYSLAHQLAEREIWANSVLPGSFHTQMNKTRIERGLENIGYDNFQLALSRINEDEADKYQKLYALMEFLCSAASDGIYARLISAQYDDWKNNVSRLKNKQDDLYTMIRKKN